MDIIEEIAKTAIAIKVPNGVFVDSVPQYDETPAKAFKKDMSYTDMKQFGMETSGIVFYVYGLSAKPKLPCKAVYEGETYDIVAAKEYKDFDGTILGHKLAVAGASL